jgi:hypothetical protein
MNLGRLLTFVAILVAGLAIVLIFRPHRQWKQPRVYVNAEARQAKSTEESSVDWREDFRSACPHMALVGSDEHADYIIEATWFPSPPLEAATWTVTVERRDYVHIYRDSSFKSPDSMKLLRESCHAIRADVDDWGEFGKPLKAAPSVGRYALSSQSNRALLLDTKTGAVWELVQDSYLMLGKQIPYRKFSRISVEGLYTSGDEREDRTRFIEGSSDTEDKKKALRNMYEKSWQEERQRADALNEQ